ncbi:GIY-YIG nuclease family protein [Pararhizobium qamdonense]|uniref:GIY-YIG nuclease family protein n=1 Tax=Pararhizobium qamdonense TaxID=3031126 RepID=UPI0023E1C122|nr:GIY-YIG nuclease family protein [Pararhizobium qamdonense]
MDWSEFTAVADMKVTGDGNGIHVSITDVVSAQLTETVYVWLDGSGNALRIGTSKPKVSKRLLQYNRYINKALAGLGGGTPLWEANAWLDLVREQTLTAVVHQPPEIATVAGMVRPHLDIERLLIQQLNPRLNRSRR